MGLNVWVGTANRAPVSRWFGMYSMDIAYTAVSIMFISVQCCSTQLKCVDKDKCLIEGKEQIKERGYKWGYICVCTYLYETNSI